MTLAHLLMGETHYALWEGVKQKGQDHIKYHEPRNKARDSNLRRAGVLLLLEAEIQKAHVRPLPNHQSQSDLKSTHASLICAVRGLIKPSTMRANTRSKVFLSRISRPQK